MKDWCLMQAESQDRIALDAAKQAVGDHVDTNEETEKTVGSRLLGLNSGRPKR